MKKFVLFSCAALFAAWGAQSCLDTNIEVDPLAAGWRIYDVARSQQNVAMDGANIAFRLNVLLTEVVRQLDEDPTKEIDLSDVRITDNTGSTAVTRQLSAMLFKPNTTIDSVFHEGSFTGAYRIVYKDITDYAGVDYRRKGGVLIHTGGKLLTDPDFESWFVEGDPQNQMKIFLEYDYMTGEPIFANVDFGSNYMISRSDDDDDDKLRVNVSDYVSSMDLQWGSVQPVESLWSTIMTIRKNFNKWEYNEMVAADAKLEVYGYGGGRTMYTADNGVQFNVRSYVIPDDAPKVYTLNKSCAWNFYSSATETAEIIPDYIDRSVFPGLDITMVSASAGTCLISRTLTYDGQTKTY